jgi:glutathione S-transferase
MEARLAGRPWFAGATLSLAAIAIAPLADRLEELNFAGLWQGKPALEGRIARLKDRPGYQASLPREDHPIPAPLVA